MAKKLSITKSLPFECRCGVYSWRWRHL